MGSDLRMSNRGRRKIFSCDNNEKQQRNRNGKSGAMRWEATHIAESASEAVRVSSHAQGHTGKTIKLCASRRRSWRHYMN